MRAASVSTRQASGVAAGSGAGATRSMVALLSAGAAAIHFAVTGEHLEEFVLFGVFFAVTGVLQALWAILVMIRPSRVIYVAGAIGNLAIVVLWVVSRTAGLPVGPDAGVPEPATLLDIVATSWEVLIGVGVLALLRRAIRKPLLRTAGTVFVLAALGMLLGAAVIAASFGHHH